MTVSYNYVQESKKDAKVKTWTLPTESIDPSTQWCTEQKETHSPRGRGGYPDNVPIKFSNLVKPFSVLNIFDHSFKDQFIVIRI